MKFLKNNQVLDIREANEKDAFALTEFFECIKQEGKFQVLTESGIAKTNEALTSYLKELKNQVTSKLFLGKVSNKIVVSGGIFHSENAIKGNVLLDINVKADFLGIDTEDHMLNHVINYSRITSSIKSIDILCTEKDPLISLYEKYGFKPLNESPSNTDKNANERIYRLDL